MKEYTFTLDRANTSNKLISFRFINKDPTLSIAHIEEFAGIKIFEKEAKANFKKMEYVKFGNKFAKHRFFKEFCIMYDNQTDEVAFVRIGCAILSYKALLFLENKAFFKDINRFSILMQILNQSFGDFHTNGTKRSQEILLKATQDALKKAKS